jgi:hypothetical protein
VAVGILNHALLSLLAACAYSGLSLLGQANLILLRILRLRLSLWWVRGTLPVEFCAYEPWYRKSDQKKKRIHVASKTLAMMHEPESLHCLPPFGEKILLLSWLVLEHFSACYILLGGRRVQLFLSHWSGKLYFTRLLAKTKGEK